MWRAMFLAVGIYFCILGLESLAIEKAVMVVPKKSASDSMQIGAAGRREISPPDWAPWTLLSGGAVVMLYSFTLPRRVRS